MAVITATDAELRSIVADNKRVLVKFVDDSCAVCRALAPTLEGLSVDPRYKKIVFLRMDAGTNPVSAREVRFTKAPFFAAYRNRVIVECGVITTQQGVEELLQKLL